MSDSSGASDPVDHWIPDGHALVTGYRHSTLRDLIGRIRLLSTVLRAVTHSWLGPLAAVVLANCRKSWLYGWFTSNRATEGLVLDVGGSRIVGPAARVVVKAGQTVAGWAATSRIAGALGVVEVQIGPASAVGTVLGAAVTSNLLLLAVTGGVSGADLALRVPLGVTALFLLWTRPSRAWIRHSVVGKHRRDGSNGR